MPDSTWIDLGSVDDLKSRPVQQLTAGKSKIALIYKEGTFTAISGICNHLPSIAASLDTENARFSVYASRG